MTSELDPGEAHVDLYWLPLGAGDASHCVRTNGRLFEALAATRDGRTACDLYHSALVVHLDGVRVAIEMAPVWSGPRSDRGVVGEGPVGLRWLGRSWLFRYEVRRWHDGTIPDLDTAVASPQRPDTDPDRVRRLLELVPAFPTATWGRDEQCAGEMWNSNSLVSWLLARSGHDFRTLSLPRRGRAPGWTAGLVVAARPAPNTWPARGARARAA